MNINRGKSFEQLIHDAFNSENIFILRIYDTMYLQAKNPCDFIAVINGRPVFIECKSTYDTSFNPQKDKPETSTGYQWSCLMRASRYGLLAGYMFWFIKQDATVFVEVQDFDRYMKEHKRKSINYKDALEIGIKIKGTKKRVYYDYDMKEFIDYASKYR